MTADRRGRLRRVLLTTAALALGGLLALGVFEGLVRVLGLAPAAGLRTVDETRFHEVPGLFMPGQDLVDLQNPALPHRIRINAHGYRGAAIPEARGRDEARVLMVGDSFTFGDFVEDEETLPAVVERVLASRSVGPGCGAVRVVNAGVGGTTLVTHARMAERAAKPIAPDLVVLTFSENDIADLRRPMWEELAANRERKSRFPLSLVYPALSRTATWNFLLKIRSGLRTPARPEAVADGSNAEALRAAREREQHDRTTYRDALARLGARLARDGVPLVFAIYPAHHALVDEAQREQIEWADRTAQRLGLPSVPLLEPLLEAGLPATGLYLLPHDGHPNPEGYRRAGAHLAAAIAPILASTPRCGGAD